eukprot:scaffold1170_cov158-Ochromonas_danica.AAC.21
MMIGFDYDDFVSINALDCALTGAWGGGSLHLSRSSTFPPHQQRDLDLNLTSTRFGLDSKKDTKWEGFIHVIPFQKGVALPNSVFAIILKHPPPWPGLDPALDVCHCAVAISWTAVGATRRRRRRSD